MGYQRHLRGFIALILLALAASCVLFWRYRTPQGSPRILRVGIDNAPPYQMLTPTGGVQGLSVDMIGEAARRLSIPIVFIPVRGLLPDEALRSGLVDIWPAAAGTDERRRWLHITDPWLRNRYVLVSLKGNTIDPPGSIAGKRLPAMASIVEKRFPTSRLVDKEERADALRMMCRGEVDAALVESRYVDYALLDRPQGCEQAALQVTFVDGIVLDLCLLAKPRDARSADALRKEINKLADEGMMASSLDKWTPFSSSETMAVYALREFQRNQWLLVKGFWTALAIILLFGWQALRMHRARSALKYEQERWQLVLLANNDGIFDWDARTKRLVRTPRWKAILGYTPDELPDMNGTWHSLVHPMDVERVLDTMDAYLKKRIPSYESEYRMLHKDGSWRWVLGRAQAVWDEKGKTLRVVGTHSDITERKRAEQALAQSQQRLELALAAGELGLFDWDIVTDHVYYSDGYAAMLGYGPGDFEPDLSTWERLVHPEDKRSTLDQVQAHFGGSSVRFVVEQRMAHKDGSWRWILCRGKVVERDGDGRPTRLVGMHQDITVRKDTETALRVAKEAAEAGTRAKSEFLATMSHEIRTPLNGVIGMTSLMLTTNLNSEQQEYIETIRSSGDALLSVINEVLDFSKIEAGRMELERLDFEIRVTVGEAIELMTDAAHRKGLRLHTFIDPEVPKVLCGDPGRVRQMLLNYLSNAIKFTASGELRVAVSREGSLLRCTVTDQGIGISAEQQERLFAAFSQADSSTTRRFGGTGLGLAICRRMAELMGGAVGVESKPGVGSAFWFTIKLEPSSSKREEAHRLAAPLVAGGRVKGRVLVAEDNLTNQKVARLLLERLGCHVDTVANGREAVNAVRQAHYDLVLMDCQMPELDGYEGTREIRKTEAGTGRFTPIVALTANVQREDREECLAAGMNDYISKPVRSDALAAVICKWLANSEDKVPEPAEPALAGQG